MLLTSVDIVDTQEIDELVEDWTPEPLLQPLNEEEQQELASVPVILGPGAGPRPMLSTGQTVLNLTSFNFAGLANLQETKDRCIEILRAYGLGSCGPPGFYGSIDVAIQLERDIANFLNVESSIIYSQAFAMSSSIIPAFCKMGDVIVADAGVNFGIRKGLQNSRSTVRFYRHNDMQALEELLLQLERERRKKKLPLTRRFIVTEGLFENDGVIADLPKLIELKKKFKYRLYLDENFSFGVLGAHGRGLTEHYGIEAKEVDILCGSLGHSISACGGFCAGTRVMVEHQVGLSIIFAASSWSNLFVFASGSTRPVSFSARPCPHYSAWPVRKASSGLRPRLPLWRSLTSTCGQLRTSCCRRAGSSSPLTVAHPSFISTSHRPPPPPRSKAS